MGERIGQIKNFGKIAAVFGVVAAVAPIEKMNNPVYEVDCPAKGGITASYEGGSKKKAIEMFKSSSQCTFDTATRVSPLLKRAPPLLAKIGLKF